MRRKRAMIGVARLLCLALLFGGPAACGGSSSSDDGDPIDVPPTVTITAPADGTEFAVGELITFRGSGTDFEDGPLDPNVLTWSSSIDGPIGVGETVRRGDLTFGFHEIGLRGIDSMNQAGSASIRITVLPPLRSPSAAGDLVISEVMVLPVNVADSDGEWFEITNPTTDRILLTGLILRDLGGDSFLFSGDVELWPGEFYVFGPNRDTEANGGVDVDFVYAYGTSMTLDAVDELVLWNGSTEIDRVAWDATWPFNIGRAMGLSEDAYDPVLNDVKDNWCVPLAVYGAGNRGTPGDANPTCVP